ncbi:type II secretion system ATPase GspE [uncultured Thiohalocapsa sp.]|uniref:type II secretion system ATPase GspE n=1 Tax=uncultured Thiohalocapsa sp. TaxID=768990 RepID=UPI003459E816
MSDTFQRRQQSNDRPPGAQHSMPEEDFDADIAAAADVLPGPGIDLNLDFADELLGDAGENARQVVSRRRSPGPAAAPRTAPAAPDAAVDATPAPSPSPGPAPAAAGQPPLAADGATAQTQATDAASSALQPTHPPVHPQALPESSAVAVAPAHASPTSPEPASAVATADTDSPEAAVIAHLRSHGKLSDGDLARARKLADDGAEALRTMLVRLGLVSDRDMAAAYAAVLNLGLITAEDYPDAPVAEAELSLRFLKDARMVPLREEADMLELAVADPVDHSAVRAAEMAAGRQARLRVGLPTEIEAALERLYETPEAGEPDADMEADLGNFSEEDIEHLRDLASEAPVIRLVNQIMQRAVESRASDVHIEPFADELKVRYRIDGILKETESPPVRSTAAVISRIKIMAKLNIAERRLPQDGRIPLRVQGRELDLRVSTVPTMFGESVVMRLLDKESVRFDFDALGFDGPPRQRVLQILDQPYGIFLVTGPTGSGKSTTLYTALSRLNTEARKIITVEDPVEYQVAGINQIPVKASIGMTFAHALRAIVRQDPDVIMVGEMRDLETARIAVQSALTGHVVLSTLHTNDAASGVTRLLDMGVEDYLLTSTINGILAQRLVRRLCPTCREPFRPRPEMAARFLNLPGVDESNLTLYRPRGCEACQGSGYRGRLVIAEVLLMTDRIRQAVLNHATATEIQRIAVEQDMLTMYQDGLRKAAAGHTTVEEVLRVASVSED